MSEDKKGSVRIEISFDEYKSFQKRIEELEASSVTLSKMCFEEKKRADELAETVEWFKKIPFFARVFHWKKLTNDI